MRSPPGLHPGSTRRSTRPRARGDERGAKNLHTVLPLLPVLPVLPVPPAPVGVAPSSRSSTASWSPPRRHDVRRPEDAELVDLRMPGRTASEVSLTDGTRAPEATVETHVNHLLAKLGVRDRAQLVAWAYQHGTV